MSEIKKYTCKCENCRREFSEEEFSFTNDENKCILHCEKDMYSHNNENYDELNKYSKKLEYFSDSLKKLAIEYKKSSEYENGYFLELKKLIYPLHSFGYFEDINVHFEDCKFINDIVLSSKDGALYNFLIVIFILILYFLVILIKN
ncbi:hypothetical protein [Arcobacter sp.]|uniref:hypothetical protein n=1 Tax=unclassified Arcobacter TaxID=2593671 RepID=UPI003AFFF4D0